MLEKLRAIESKYEELTCKDPEVAWPAEPEILKEQWTSFRLSRRSKYSKLLSLRC
jgi:hypothetical protein